MISRNFICSHIELCKVEMLPWMRYIPSGFAPWKRNAEERHIQDSDIFSRLFESVREKTVRYCHFGTYEYPTLYQAAEGSRTSMCETLIRDGDRHELSMREKSWLAATM